MKKMIFMCAIALLTACGDGGSDSADSKTKTTVIKKTDLQGMWVMTNFRLTDNVHKDGKASLEKIVKMNIGNFFLMVQNKQYSMEKTAKGLEYTSAGQVRVDEKKNQLIFDPKSGPEMTYKVHKLSSTTLEIEPLKTSKKGSGTIYIFTKRK